MLQKVLWLLVGGGAGTLSRYFISVGVQGVMGSHFPFATLTVNMIGCLLMGFLMAFSAASDTSGDSVQLPQLSDSAKLMLGTGFLGALTTFSTFILELHQLFKEEAYTRFGLYLLASLLLGMLMMLLGSYLFNSFIGLLK